MATQSWSSVIDHTSDAGFRAWGSELSARLAAAGLVQTADTGQINWLTVTRASTNSDAGFEIWRFNDSLQGVAPIFIRINYGTASGANTPRMQIVVGTGSNGSGTITGTLTATLAASTGNQGIVSTAIAYQSWLCVAEGFVGLVHKRDSTTSASSGALARGGFIVCRSCDSDGTPNTTGACVIFQNGANNQAQTGAIQSLRFASTAVAYALSTHPPIYVPGSETNSVVGSDVQAYIGWMLTPQVRPIFGVAGMFASELAEGSTMSATLVGSTPRTYLSVGRQIATYIASNDPTTKSLLMLWE